LAEHTVAVTGAGGSIGAELCRQAARLGVGKLVLIEQAEPALFNIMHELRGADLRCEVIPAICDVTDRERVRSLLSEHRPKVIFHAAAHKHVPLMEQNAGEAIKNNVFGTRVMVEEADAAEVETFVLISTDKAVNPTSVMGATKRVAELLTQGMSTRSKTKFLGVRFGNVLGSAGSVIPIFRKQIRGGGPVTVTHPEMTRYFMTIPEASQLVIQAGAMGKGGEIFVLDMGEPVKILDLARDLIEFSGLVPDRDIKIVFSGVRPGEKLFEELGFDAEKMDKTRHPKIFTGKLAPVAWKSVVEGLRDLEEHRQSDTRSDVRAALGKLVPEMQIDAGAQVGDGEKP
jgi:FlaA1/EpsC-like NDP-sugar epimerase